MKLLSAVLFLAALVHLEAAKVSNAVPSTKSKHAVGKARPARDLQYRYGQPVYKTFEELQRASSPYQSPAYQPFADYSNPSPRTCCLDKKKKEQPVHIQPVYIPYQAPHQECHQEYQQISVPYTTYHQVSVPHTEYHQVTVPVQKPVQYQYHAVQQYYPQEYNKKPCCGKSADGAPLYPAELPSQYQAYERTPEYVNPALKESALYQAIERPFAPAYDRNADMNRYAQYQDTGRSAQIYQPDGKAAYSQAYENAEVPEMKAAKAPEMKSAAAPEMKSASAPDMKSAQADGRQAAYADMNQRNAMTPEFNRNAAYPDTFQQNAFTPLWARNSMNQADGRSAYAPELNRNAAYPDMYQRDAIAPEFSRNAAYPDMYQRIAPEFNRNAAYPEMYQRDAIAPEFNRNAAYPEMYQRDAIAPQFSRNAYDDMYQRDAIAPQFSRNAAYDDYQRGAIAPPWGRDAAYDDMYQRAPIAPEWNRNVMYQPDGIQAYADMYQRNAQPRGMYLRPYPESGRNAELPAAEKSVPVLKAAAPEKTPVPAPKDAKANSDDSAAKKGKSNDSEQES